MYYNWIANRVDLDSYSRAIDGTKFRAIGEPSSKNLLESQVQNRHLNLTDGNHPLAQGIT